MSMTNGQFLPYFHQEEDIFLLEYEVDFSSYETKRTGYTFGNFIIELGSVIVVLFLVGSCIVGCFKGDGRDHAILEGVFKEEGTLASDGTYSPNAKLGEISTRQPFRSKIRIYFCDWLLCCLRTKRSKTAQSLVDQELDVTTFIKKQKMQEIALNTLFTQMDRYLMENNKYFLVGGGFAVTEHWFDGCNWNN